jgi:hypothetical protein
MLKSFVHRIDVLHDTDSSSASGNTGGSPQHPRALAPGYEGGDEDRFLHTLWGEFVVVREPDWPQQSAIGHSVGER